MIIAVLIAPLGCGDDGSCEDPEQLISDIRVCSYEAQCAGETLRLESSWLPVSGGESEVTYHCWGTGGTTKNKKTIKVAKNPPPFCEAAGFKEHCGLDVTLPGK
jgi:hypothetical protein